MTTLGKTKTVASVNKESMAMSVADQGAALPSSPVKVKKPVSKTAVKVSAKADKLSVKPVAAGPVDVPVKATVKVKTPAKNKSDKPVKLKKIKLVRGSFSLPKVEREVLRDLKTRAQELARPVKKSTLLRAGIKALAAMSDAAFLATLKGVAAVKAR